MISFDVVAGEIATPCPDPDPRLEGHLGAITDVLRRFIGMDSVDREIIFHALAFPGYTRTSLALHLTGMFRKHYTKQAVQYRIRAMRKTDEVARVILKPVDIRGASGVKLYSAAVCGGNYGTTQETN